METSVQTTLLWMTERTRLLYASMPLYASMLWGVKFKPLPTDKPDEFGLYWRTIMNHKVGFREGEETQDTTKKIFEKFHKQKEREEYFKEHEKKQREKAKAKTPEEFFKRREGDLDAIQEAIEANPDASPEDIYDKIPKEKLEGYNKNQVLDKIEQMQGEKPEADLEKQREKWDAQTPEEYFTRNEGDFEKMEKAIEDNPELNPSRLYEQIKGDLEGYDRETVIDKLRDMMDPDEPETEPEPEKKHTTQSAIEHFGPKWVNDLADLMDKYPALTVKGILVKAWEDNWPFGDDDEIVAAVQAIRDDKKFRTARSKEREEIRRKERELANSPDAVARAKKMTPEEYFGKRGYAALRWYEENKKSKATVHGAMTLMEHDTYADSRAKGVPFDSDLILEKVRQGLKEIREERLQKAREKRKVRERAKPKGTTTKKGKKHRPYHIRNLSYGGLTSKQVDDVNVILNTIPKEHTETISKLAFRQSTSPRHHASSGWHRSMSKAIQVTAKSYSLDLRETLAHEVGHHVWQKAPEEKKREFVKRLKKAKIRTPTTYMESYQHLDQVQFPTIPHKRAPGQLWNEIHSEAYSYIYAPEDWHKMEGEIGYWQPDFKQLKKAAEIAQEVFGHGKQE